MNNANLYDIMSFDDVMSRLSIDGYKYCSELDSTYGDEEYYGRDINGNVTMMMRDGENTARVSPLDKDFSNVKFDYVASVLSEHGFDVLRSTWYDSQAVKIQKDDEPGYIYVMQMEGTNVFKIGRTKHYRSRVKLLGVLMPKPCDFVGVWETKYMRTVESVLHKDNAIHNTNGEWFEIPDINKIVKFMDASNKRVL